MNRNNYYQEGWLATGNVRGVVGVTFTSSHARRPHELPLRTNYNLRGHRSDVSMPNFLCFFEIKQDLGLTRGLIRENSSPFEKHVVGFLLISATHIPTSFSYMSLVNVEMLIYLRQTCVLTASLVQW